MIRTRMKKTKKQALNKDKEKTKVNTNTRKHKNYNSIYLTKWYGESTLCYGNIEEIYLEYKGGEELGFSISGSAVKGITVKCISPEGVAGRNGRLQIGDLILKINDEDLYRKSRTFASGLIRNSSPKLPYIYLLVARGEIGG